MRPKQILTVLGRIYFHRAYYLCTHCHTGQSPLDSELDVEGTECSPGVRRMMALVGSDVPFEHGRRLIEELAGLNVTAKTIERHAEAIGADIAEREQVQAQNAIQLPLPEVQLQDIPLMYVEMDATGVPVVSSETEGRTGKNEGVPAHTREAKLGCVFTQTTTDDRGLPVREEDLLWYAYYTYQRKRSSLVPSLPHDFVVHPCGTFRLTATNRQTHFSGQSRNSKEAR